MKKNYALVLMAIVALGISACKEKTSTESTETSTVGGTTVETTTSTETTTDGEGNSTTETNRETTVDPEGLGNKTTTEETHTETQSGH